MSSSLPFSDRPSPAPAAAPVQEPPPEVTAGASITAADGTVIATVARRRRPAGPGEPGPVVVVGVTGDIDLETAPLIEATLIQALDGDERVCLDVSGVRFFGATGVRVVVTAGRHAAVVGHDFRLAGVHGLIERVLAITGLHPRT